MQKKILLFIFILTVGLIPKALFGQISFYEDFESGSFSTNGWFSTSGATIQSSIVYAGSNALSHYSGSSLLTKNFSNISFGNIFVTLYFRYSSDGWRYVIAFNDSSSNLEQFQVRIATGSSSFGAFNGMTYQEFQSANAGQWYKVSVIANVYTRKYDVYIDDTLKASQFDFRYAGTPNQLQIGATSGGVVYFDNISIFSSSATINSPNQVFPSSNGKMVSLNPVLKWDTAGTNASRYSYQVTMDSSFSTFTNGVNDSTSVKKDTVQIFGLIYGTKYYWRVRSSDGIGSISPWTAKDSFYTIIPAPDLVFPSMSATGILSADSLRWTKVSSASSGYRMQLSTFSNFSSIFRDTTVSNAADTIYHLWGMSGNTTYYWRVQGIKAVGDSSFSSGSRSFTTGNIAGETVTDIDGNVYNTVTIGTQIWMVENLKTTRYRNGDPIPNVTVDTVWNSLLIGAYCNYNNNIINVNTYGRLYNAYAVLDSRQIAPEGWHVPTDAEWQILIDYLGGESVAGGKLKESGLVNWTSPNTGATNETGFTALPGGHRGHHTGIFADIGSLGLWYSSTENGVEYLYDRRMRLDIEGVIREFAYKYYGFSVRCLKGNVSIALSAPSMLFPISNIKMVSRTPVLKWNITGTNAQIYDYIISTNANLNSPIALGSTSTNIDTITPSVTLNYNTKYYWSVRSRNGIDSSSWAPVDSFFTAIPNPNLLYPAMSATGVSLTDSLKWSKVSEAISGYRLQISNASNFSSIFRDTVVSNVTDTVYRMSGMLGNTTYYWRVQGIKAVGDSSFSSGSRSFTTGNIAGETVTDIDGNIYNTVTIGTQIWMVENLKTTRYRNGDTIPNVTDGTSWSGLTTGGYCNYDNNIVNANTYGRLYNAYAVLDSRQIAPTGWHVPTDTEWQILIDYLGGESVSGGKLKESGIAHWTSPNTGATNETGFTSLPSGFRSSNSTFYYIGSYCDWWSSSAYNSNYLWIRYMIGNSSVVTRAYDNLKTGYSIRCLKGDISIALSAPSMLFPIGNIKMVSRTPKLQWDIIGTNAQTYEYIISANVNLNSPVIFGSTSTNVDTATAAVILNYNTKYYWSVRSRNGSDSSVWAPVDSFFTVIPNPNLLYPAMSATGVSLTDSLKWNKVSVAASGYRIQISTVSNFSTLFKDTTTAAASDTVYHMGGMNLSTTYYWRVQGIKTPGDSSYSSEVRTFTTISPYFKINPMAISHYNIQKGTTLLDTLTISNISNSPINITNMLFQYLDDQGPVLKKDNITGNIPNIQILNSKKMPKLQKGEKIKPMLSLQITSNQPSSDPLLFPVRPVHETFSVIQNSAPVTIPGQDSIKVVISMKADSAGSYAYNLLMKTNAPGTDSLLSICLEGTVIDGQMSLNKSILNFGNILLGSSTRYDTLTVRNNGTSTIFSGTVLKKGDSSAYTKISPTTDTMVIMPGSTRQVILALNRTAEGYYVDSLMMSNNSINMPSVIIPIIASIVQPAYISVNKTSLNYSSGYLSSPIDSVITVTNTSNYTLLVISSTNFELKDSLFQVLTGMPLNINPGSSANITVRFNPYKIGTHSTILHLINNSENAPDKAISIGGNVLGSTISIYPKSINFGDVGYMSDSRDTIVTVMNTGPYYLNFNFIPPSDSSLSIIGDKPSGGITIKPGTAYSGIKVRLTPNKQGSDTDTMTIISNASNSQTDRIPITRNIVQSTLFLSATSLDFETTSLSKPITKGTFYITNKASFPITISEMSITGDSISFYFTGNTKNINLAPNQTDTFSIIFSPHTAGTKTASLKITSTDPVAKNKYITLTGTGGGKPILSYSLAEINFGEVPVGQAKDTLLVLRNEGNLDLNITGKSVTGDDNSYFSLSENGGAATLQSLRSDSMRISISGALPLGTKSAQLQIVSNDSANSTMSLGLSAFIIAPMITKEVKSINIDSVLVGSSYDTSFTIKNTGNCALVLNRIYFDGPSNIEFSLIGDPANSAISPNEERVIQIRFTPTDRGSRDARIIINSNDPLSPEISVILHGLGKVKPVINVLQTVLNYGYVDSTRTKDLIFTIKNSGSAVLNIYSLNITGYGASVFSIITPQLPFQINQKDTQSVTVRYSPSASIKNPSALVSVSNNDLSNPIINVNLSATSTKPSISVDSVLFFSPIGVNDSSQQVLAISNNSPVYLTIDTIYFDAIDENPFKLGNIALPIKIDPSNKYNLTIKYNPISPKSISNYLNIKSSDANPSLLRTKIVGIVKKPKISVQPLTLDFKFVELNTFKDTTLTIGNSGEINLQIDSLSINGLNSTSFIVMGVSLPASIPPSKTQDVTIRFFPGTTKSTSFASLNVVSNDLDKPSITIALSGAGDAPLIVCDSIVDFGKIVVLDSVQKDLKITNSSNLNLRIDSLVITSDTNKVFTTSGIKAPLVMGQNSSTTMSLKYYPKLAKITSAYLNIYSNDRTKNPLRVNITGGATAPKMVLPTIVSFGKLKIDSSKTLKAGISNTGDGYLQINNIILSGKDTSEFMISPKIYPYRINPGQNDSITIQFNPKTTGKKDAKIAVFSSNQAISGDITIDAEGIKQNLVINQTAIYFGDVVYSKTKTDSILLQNQGTSTITINSITLMGASPNQFGYLNNNPATPFTVGPNQQKSLLIQYHPDSLGIKNANIIINSTDPILPNLMVSLAGNCISPVLSSVSQINFGNLRVNAIRDTLFVIKNTGIGNLIMKSVALTGKDSAEFKITKLNSGKELITGESDTIAIRCTPVSVGEKIAALILRSNYYDNQNINLPITAKGINPKLTVSVTKIELGKVFAIKTKDTTLSIKNDGTDNLNIKNIFVSGTDSLSYQLSSLKYSILKNIILTPGEEQVIGIRLSPVTTGIKNGNIVIESDDPVSGKMTVQLSGEGYVPSVTMDNDLIADEKKDKTINFHLSDNFTPNMVKIFYRVGGGMNYDSASIINGIIEPSTNTINYSYTFNKTLITKDGLDFYIKVSWDGAIVAIPQTNYVKYPLSLQIKLNVLLSDFSLIIKSYSMVTIPLLFKETTLLTEMIRNLGNINNSSWRIFKYRNEEYEEYLDETTWIMKPGDGFWLIANNNKKMNFQDCITVPTGSPYTITLQPGWNQIGSPFLFNVPFSNIIVPTGKNVENMLWAWTGDDGYKMERTTINPWMGYFIKNNEKDSVNIMISATSGSTLAKIENTGKFLTDEWKMLIETEINGRTNQSSEIGCLMNSIDEWDANDISEPPFINAKYFSLRFPHNDWKAYKGNYVRDYKSVSKDGKTWEMEIMNLTGSRDAEIRFTVQGNVPKDYQTILFDYNLNKSFKITNSHKFKFNESEQERKFKLLVGTKEYVDNNKLAEITPLSFKLLQNYPNPFNPSTMVSYQLPKDCFVTLKIYDMMGREIKALVLENQLSGSYEVRWNAGNVPSGVYYYRLQAGSFTDIKKLVLLK